MKFSVIISSFLLSATLGIALPANTLEARLCGRDDATGSVVPCPWAKRDTAILEARLCGRSEASGSLVPCPWAKRDTATLEARLCARDEASGSVVPCPWA